MELTDENLDYPDCRPLNSDNGVKYRVPDWMRELINQRKERLNVEKQLESKPPSDFSQDVD
ncbi:hypothetical protein [Acidisoma sp. 7E03]